VKVALCLFGQPRLIENPYTYPSHFNWIINKYDTDVYAHSWISNENKPFTYSDWGIRMGLADIQAENTKSIILNNYTPKTYLFEEPKTFYLEEDVRKKVELLDYYSLNNENNLMSHIYSMSKSIELIDKNTDYDWVIISRYDNYIESLPDFNSLDKDNLYLSDRYGHFCDVIIFGGLNHILTLNCFEDFNNLCNSVGNFTAEEFKKAAYRKKYTEEKRVRIEAGLVRTLTLENLQK
jgi:hypothetical protein